MEPKAEPGIEEAVAWSSYHLVEVLVQREAVVMATILLRAAGIETRVAADGKSSLYPATLEAVRQANAVYSETLTEWFGLFLAAHKSSREHASKETMPIWEVLDRLQDEASRVLLDRVSRQIVREERFGWSGEYRRRILAELRKTVTVDRNARDALPTLQGMPSDPQEAAYNILRLLGYDDKIAEGAVAKSLGFTPPNEEGGQNG